MFLTPNLHLRALNPETDTAFLLQWRNDVTFMHALRTDPAVPCSAPEAKEFVEKLIKREHGLPIFAVCERFPSPSSPPSSSSSGDRRSSSGRKGKDDGGKEAAAPAERYHRLENPHEDLFRDEHGRTRYPMVGVLNINPGNHWHWASRACSIGVALHESLVGRGYGTELMSWACEYIFNTLGLHRITLMADGHNARAIRCYEKVGYVLEGRQRKTHWRDGQWHDSVFLGMLEEDWVKIKEAREI